MALALPLIALDTNTLARLLLGDDAAQLSAVKRLLSGQALFTAPVTVMLELVWVLEAHERARADIHQALLGLLGLPNFQPAELEAVNTALQGYAQGMDFADALHLALSQRATEFKTFDKQMVRLATKLGRRLPVSKV